MQTERANNVVPIGRGLFSETWGVRALVNRALEWAKVAEPQRSLISDRIMFELGARLRLKSATATVARSMFEAGLPEKEMNDHVERRLSLALAHDLIYLGGPAVVEARPDEWTRGAAINYTVRLGVLMPVEPLTTWPRAEEAKIS